MHQYAILGTTLYFHFGVNNTSGNATDADSPAVTVRRGGAASDAAPVQTITPTLLSHASYPNGAYEVVVVATTGNTYVAGETYGLFSTAAVGEANPIGMIGGFTLAAIPAAAQSFASGLDFTSAMSATINAQADQALSDYDPPTRAELTTDTNSIITQVNANETKIDTIDGIVDSILADTNELQTDWADGGRLDEILDDATAGGDATLANQTTMLSNLSDILADTAELQGDWTNGGRLDLILDAIGAPPSAASIVSTLLANDMENSKTLAQLLLDLWAVIAGDSAANSATAPTSITYDSPDGTVQRTHTLTPTSRAVS